MTVSVHRSVDSDLSSVEQVDAGSAEQVRVSIGQLADGEVSGLPTGRDGERLLTPVPGFGILVDGVGTDHVRVLGVAPLPTLYDADELRERARAAEFSNTAARADRTVPSPAPRTRIVALDLAESLTDADDVPRRRG